MSLEGDKKNGLRKGEILIPKKKIDLSKQSSPDQNLSKKSFDGIQNSFRVPNINNGSDQTQDNSKQTNSYVQRQKSDLEKQRNAEGDVFNAGYQDAISDAKAQQDELDDVENNEEDDGQSDDSSFGEDANSLQIPEDEDLDNTNSNENDGSYADPNPEIKPADQSEEEIPDIDEGGTSNEGVGNVTKKSGTSEAMDKAKQAASEAIKAKFQEYKKKIAQKFTKQAMAALVKSPYFWLVVAIIIGLIVIIALAAAYWGQIQDFYSNGPSKTGTTQLQQSDPLSDKNTIQTVLLLSGDKAIYEELASGTAAKLKVDLQELSKENFSTEVTNKSNAIILLIDAFTLSPDKTKAKEIVKQLKELVNLVAIIPAYTGSTNWPIHNLVLSPGFTPHGKSSMNVADNHGHNVIYGVFAPKGLCDALDLVIPSSMWGGNKVNVYPVFDGKVTKVTKLSSSKDIDLVIIENGKYKILYTDIKGVTVKEGDSVTTSTAIGKVMNKLIHIQVSYNDICMQTTKSDKDSYTNGSAYGQLMLNHFKTAFKLK